MNCKAHHIPFSAVPFVGRTPYVVRADVALYSLDHLPLYCNHPASSHGHLSSLTNKL